MGKSRKKYSAEFKLEAVRMASQGDRTPTEVARGLGISPSVIQRWKAAYDERGEEAFAGRRKADTSDCEEAVTAEEVRRLRRELEEARKDRDVLKKALAYFANQKD